MSRAERAQVIAEQIRPMIRRALYRLSTERMSVGFGFASDPELNRVIRDTAALEGLGISDVIRRAVIAYSRPQELRIVQFRRGGGR